MTDTTTKKPLLVSTDSTVGPYIELPVSQLDEVRRLLDSRHIAYWVVGRLHLVQRGSGRGSLTWAAEVMRPPFRQSWTRG